MPSYFPKLSVNCFVVRRMLSLNLEICRAEPLGVRLHATCHAKSCRSVAWVMDTAAISASCCQSRMVCMALAIVHSNVTRTSDPPAPSHPEGRVLIDVLETTRPRPIQSCESVYFAAKVAPISRTKRVAPPPALQLPQLQLTYTRTRKRTHTPVSRAYLLHPSPATPFSSHPTILTPPILPRAVTTISPLSSLTQPARPPARSDA